MKAASTELIYTLGNCMTTPTLLSHTVRHVSTRRLDATRKLFFSGGEHDPVYRAVRGRLYWRLL